MPQTRTLYWDFQHPTFAALRKVKGEYGYDSWVDLCAKGKRKPTASKSENPQEPRAYLCCSSRSSSRSVANCKSDNIRAVIVLVGMETDMTILTRSDPL